MTSVVSMLLVPFRLIWGFSKGLIAGLLVLSVALNLAMVTVSGVYAADSGTVSAVGIGTVAAREAGHRLAVRKAVRNTIRMGSKSGLSDFVWPSLLSTEELQ